MKSKIFGYGEIGKSLAEVYHLNGIDIAWKDLNDSHGDDDCELLNVCIPFGNKLEYFGNSVLVEIKNSGAKYVVIHSTVAPGTTSEIQKRTNAIICHSPVIGVHPNLKVSLITFTKWFGGGCPEIIGHFRELGMIPKMLDKPEATEIMKLWDTTYYGMCLAINAEVTEMLEKYDVPYENWVEYLKEYNNGYMKMNKANVQRPYFNTLSMPIGGHCVVPNYEILCNYIDKDLLKLIKKRS